MNILAKQDKRWKFKYLARWSANLFIQPPFYGRMLLCWSGVYIYNLFYHCSGGIGPFGVVVSSIHSQYTVELEAPLGGLLWVRVLIFALYFGADLCTPYHCVSPWNLQSYMYISSALCAHSSTMKSAYTTNLTSSTYTRSRFSSLVFRHLGLRSWII